MVAAPDERLRAQCRADPPADLTPQQLQANRKSRELYFARGQRGRVAFKGRLDAEAGAALDAFAAPRPREEGEPDHRSPARRNADALVELVEHALNSGTLSSGGGERPHLTDTAGYEQLRAGAGSGLLDRGGAITASSARRLACDARIVPVVLGGKSEPLDVGRGSYAVPQPLRRALVARDGGCAFPACDRPASWCHAHHIVPWQTAGPQH